MPPAVVVVVLVTINQNPKQEVDLERMKEEGDVQVIVMTDCPREGTGMKINQLADVESLLEEDAMMMSIVETVVGSKDLVEIEDSEMIIVAQGEQEDLETIIVVIAAVAEDLEMITTEADE
jgi:hypothetical protein